MRNTWKMILAAALCLAMILSTAPAAAAETAANNGVPSEQSGTDAIAAEPFAEDLSAGKEKPDLSPVRTNLPEKDPAEVNSASAEHGAEPHGEKPDLSVTLTGPAEPDKPAVSSEQNGETRGNVYSGEMYLGGTYFEINAGNTTFLSFVPAETGTYRFYTMEDASSDTYGFLQNEGKTQLASSDDEGYGRNFMITYDLTAGQTYYVGARYYGDSTSGGFIVRAELFRSADYTLKCGKNWFTIEKSWETVYMKYIPEASGDYRIYSVDSSDMFLCLADDMQCVYATEDDSGYEMQFEYDLYLEQGEVYWFGVRSFDPGRIGDVVVMIERQRTSTDPLYRGVNWFSIEDPGETVYRSFTAPKEGLYWIYSAGWYIDENSFVIYDTIGTVADSDMHVFCMDDDSGYNVFSKMACYCTQGEVLNIGMRFYGSGDTGSIPVVIEHPYVEDTPYFAGSNTCTVLDAGSIVYRPFTPTESAVYRVCSAGSYDTFGVVADKDLCVAFYSDDTSSDSNFSYTYYMEAGVKYYIGARFYSTGATGSFEVRIEKAESPSVFDGTIEWDPNDVEFRGSTPYVIADGSEQTPQFTVKDVNGHVVDPQYYYWNYAENINAGTGYVIVSMTGGGYEGELTGWFKIYLPATEHTYVENKSDGIFVKWDPVPGAAGYVIYRRAWSTTTNGWTAFARWDNTTETSYLDGHDDSHKVYAGTRYQYGVKAYFAQRTDPISGAVIGGNVGDNFNLGMVGPLKTTVRITARELTKLTAGDRTITVTWSPSKNFTGYQIQYATDANFTKNATAIKIADATVSSKKFGSLTNGTLYYFRVRSYHEFEGMTYFGCWSNVLSGTPAAQQTSPTYRAVCVGENNYSDNPLRGCVNDMNAVAGMLRGLKTPYQVTTLPNSTKSQIINAIRTVCGSTKEGDVTLFSFSGHGVMIVDSGGNPVYDNVRFGALCTIDDQYLSFTELANELSKAKGHVIVLLDSCHSGASIAKGVQFDPDVFNLAAIAAFAAYDAEESTRMGALKQSKFTVITAASYTQSSYDGRYDGSGYYQGAFTAALIKGMGCSFPNGAYSGSMPADKDKNKSVTLKELYDYTYSTAYNWTSGTGTPQRAQYYGTDAEVLFKR